MMNNENERPTVGLWLAAASIVLIVSLALHPPPPSDSAAFLDLIAAEGETWVFAHWLGAGAFAAFVVTALLALITNTGGPSARSAWAVLAVGAFATLVTAVTEATVISQAAGAGDTATFAGWQRFTEGMSMGFVLMGLGFAGIAWNQSRAAAPTMPRWSGRTAGILALASSLAWVLTMGVDLAPAGPVWLVTAFGVSLWLVWYGIGLVRGVPTRHVEASHA